MDGYPEAIGAALRGEAAARKVSYRDLAVRTGIPLRTLARYMTGERAISVENFMQIAEALGASATDMMADAVRRAGSDPDPT